MITVLSAFTIAASVVLIYWSRKAIQRWKIEAQEWKRAASSYQESAQFWHELARDRPTSPRKESL